jgi:hypothetical protein
MGSCDRTALWFVRVNSSSNMSRMHRETLRLCGEKPFLRMLTTRCNELVWAFIGAAAERGTACPTFVITVCDDTGP